MKEEESIYEQIINEIPAAEKGKLFGAPSIKASNGKNVAFLLDRNMTFKLDKNTQRIALNLSGAKMGTHIYDKNRSMRGWISLPKEHQEKWKEFAEVAIRFAMQ